MFGQIFFTKRILKKKKVTNLVLKALLFLPIAYFALNIVVGERGFIKSREMINLIKQTSDELQKEKEKTRFLMASQLALIQPNKDSDILQEKSFENFGQT